MAKNKRYPYTRGDIDAAYRQLKQDSYFDSVDLFLRDRIATFESSTDFEKRLDSVVAVLNDLLHGASPDSIGLLNEWINKINFHCLPKSFKSLENESNQTGPLLKNDRVNNIIHFISNDRSLQEYAVDKANYYIDAPIELHIIDIIWSTTVGPILDKDLIEYCLGNRLDLDESGIYNSRSSRLFKLYYKQYATWRDKAIEYSLRELSENKRDIIIIGLDIKQFYYNTEVDWVGIRNRFKSELYNNTFFIKLTEVINNMRPLQNAVWHLNYSSK